MIREGLRIASRAAFGPAGGLAIEGIKRLANRKPKKKQKDIPIDDFMRIIKPPKDFKSNMPMQSEAIPQSYRYLYDKDGKRIGVAFNDKRRKLL